MTDPTPSHEADTIGWLLDGDASIRWQTLRDLTDQPEHDIARERKQVARGGWGARLLEAQNPAGTWGGGIYTPKWTSTTYTLLLLRRLGIDRSNRACHRGARHLLDDADWLDGGVSYWKTHKLAEICVNGMILSVASYFELANERVDGIADLLLRSQFEDGGWNCDQRKEAHHSSFNTTISVLEGLLEYQRSSASPHPGMLDAMRGGHRFLAEHRMFRSCRSDDVIDKRWTMFSFPPRWHYDTLRGLDYLRDAGAERDPRYQDGIELVEQQRRPDGRWKLQNRHRGEEHFLLETGSAPSRWNTLRAMRVLRWWDDPSAKTG